MVGEQITATIQSGFYNCEPVVDVSEPRFTKHEAEVGQSFSHRKDKGSL